MPEKALIMNVRAVSSAGGRWGEGSVITWVEIEAKEGSGGSAGDRVEAKITDKNTIHTQ